MENPKLAASRPLGSHSMVALIPARAGSKRCPGKNTRLLGGKPLWVWSFESAKASGLFEQIFVSSDDNSVVDHANTIEPFSGLWRPPELAQDDSPDFAWVAHAMKQGNWEIFAILRPTSPFRTASTIKRAYAELIASGADSIRAVEPVKQHPEKMWQWNGRTILPVLDGVHADGTPWHSSPTQSLQPFLIQNASMEMAWTRVLTQHRTISGQTVAGLLTDPVEGFDINTEADFAEAERLAAL